MPRPADREDALAWALLLPSVIYLVVLLGASFALAIAFPFSNATTGDPSPDFVGLRNLMGVFRDAGFWRSLANTVIFTLASTPLIVVFGQVLANILVADFRGKRVVRSLTLLPWTTPVALSAISWLWMLDSTTSPIDWALRQVGMADTGAGWPRQPGLAMTSIVVVHVWRLTPLAAAIMMAGLISIPKDITEAARIDGAGFWLRMFGVTLPLTMPVIAVAGLLGAIITCTDMTVVYVLTHGEPTGSTHVLASWAYLHGVERGDIGQGTTIALLLLPVLLAGVIAILRAVRRMEAR